MNRVSKLVTLLVGIGALPVAFFGAPTPPALMITTNTGQTALIDSTPSVTFGGTCTAATCTTTSGPSTGGPGTRTLSWSGTLGPLTVTIVNGTSNQTVPGDIFPPALDLGGTVTTGAMAGMITLEWSDTGFTFPVTGGTVTCDPSLCSASGGVTGSFQAYFNSMNTLFGIPPDPGSILVGTVGFGGSATGTSGPTTTPYSITDVATLSLPGNSTANFDLLLVATPGTPPPPSPVVKGDTATIGFWRNKNGQAVINAATGTPTLGNWLASNFPNLFGTSNPYTGTSLAGLTNAQVAAVYSTVGNSGVQNNTYIQVFATALACYVTSTTLGGQSLINSGLAAKYGFNVSLGGTCAKTFNVGNNGAAAGVPNGTSLTVMQLLAVANANFNPATGLFYGGDPTLTGDLNNIFNGINSTGDIS
jgi:hypothetical protein